MIRCNVCGKKKDSSEFAIYYHSTFKKHYQRKECKKCFALKRKKYKKIKKEEKLIFCKGCDEWYHAVDYYGIDPTTGELKIFTNKSVRCYNCRKEATRKNNARHYRYAQEKKKDPNNPLYELVMEQPGEYVSDGQKEMTFEFMLLIGFKYNKELKLWWKDGFKNKKGEFQYG